MAGRGAGLLLQIDPRLSGRRRRPQRRDFCFEQANALVALGQSGVNVAASILSEICCGL
jgi:hypothetical protein